MPVKKRPRLTKKNPKTPLYHVATLKHDFDLVYEFLLDADQYNKQDKKRNFKENVAKAFQNQIEWPKFLKGESNARKSRRQRVRRAVSKAILREDVYQHLGPSKMVKQYEKLFNSLYWSFSELHSKLVEPENEASEEAEADPLDVATPTERAKARKDASYHSQDVRALGNIDKECKSVDALLSRTAMRATREGQKDPVPEDSHPAKKQDEQQQSLPEINNGLIRERLHSNEKFRREGCSAPGHRTEVRTGSFNRAVLIHLKHMLQDQLTTVVQSALANVANHKDYAKDISSVSHPVVLRSGHIRMCVHSEKPLSQQQLEFFQEDAFQNRIPKASTMTWVNLIEMAAMEKPPFRVKIWSVKTEELPLHDAHHKMRTMRKLFELNPSTFQSMSDFGEFLDIYWYESSPVAVLASRELANKILDNGLLYNNWKYNCGIDGADELLARCFNCQEYGHHFTACDNPTCCSRCGLSHSVAACKSLEPSCPVCREPHMADNDECIARRGIQDQIKNMRFPSIPAQASRLLTMVTTPQSSLASSEPILPRSKSSSVPSKPTTALAEPTPAPSELASTQPKPALAKPKPNQAQSKPSRQPSKRSYPRTSSNPGKVGSEHQSGKRVQDKGLGARIHSDSILRQIDDMQKRITALHKKASDCDQLEAPDKGLMDELLSLQKQITTLRPSSQQEFRSTQDSRPENPAKRQASGYLMSGGLGDAELTKRIKVESPTHT